MQEKRISDLNLAAYVLALDFPLIRVEGARGRQEFIFRVPEDVVIRYYTDEAHVNARKLFDAHRNLKGLLYQGT